MSNFQSKMDVCLETNEPTSQSDRGSIDSNDLFESKYKCLEQTLMCNESTLMLSRTLNNTNTISLINNEIEVSP